MKNIKYISLFFIFSIFTYSSCVKNMVMVPLDEDEITAERAFEDPVAYRQFLAKLYAGLAVSGQQGPAGMPDISGIDEGFSQYVRCYWNSQELTTDEAICAWSDDGIPELHSQNWTASNDFVTAMYNRIFFQIMICNEYIRETTDEKLDQRGESADLKAQVKTYRSEARFLRALSYWHALDIFRNVPFVTEDNPAGAFFPEQTNATDLYSYIEEELKDMMADLPDAGTNEYARADKAAAQMLLAKLYLNAKVYIGTEKYTECIEQCNNIIEGGYSLEPNYEHLFLADNHNSNEVIFPVAFDGVHTKTYGGTTFIISAGLGGSMNPDEFGIGGGWAGNRVTSSFVNKFSDISGDTDTRAMFHTAGQNLDISIVEEFTHGYAIKKFKNVTSTGTPGADQTFPDTDFPMFRLADAYLMYAEAVLRGGSGGDQGTAIGYINELRERAYGDQSGNITGADLTLDFILDERSRELYWEGHRRTDLVRYGKLTGSSYIWPWKGGTAAGTSTDVKYDIFPIPSSDIGANPNLQQNPGY